MEYTVNAALPFTVPLCSEVVEVVCGSCAPIQNLI